MIKGLSIGGAAVLMMLSGCDEVPPQSRLSVVTRGAEPIYQYRADGKILPTACMSRQPAGYGSVPSGCSVDSAFAAQVSHKHDLVRPHRVGNSYSARPARVAYEYIYGAPQNANGLGQPQPGILIPVQQQGAAPGNPDPQGPD